MSGVKRYRKKPVVIEAVQYKKGRIGDTLDFVPQDLIYYSPKENEYYIRTLEGDHQCSEGDYIIKGVAGEFYPCKENIFLQTYDFVEQSGEKKKNINVEETLAKSNELLKIQGYGNCGTDDYMRGMYNGMEIIISLFEGREPVYKEPESTDPTDSCSVMASISVFCGDDEGTADDEYYHVTKSYRTKEEAATAARKLWVALNETIE